MLRFMARAVRPPPMASPLPPAVLRLLRTRGRDAALVAERCGLPSATEHRDDVPVDAGVTHELLAAAAHEFGEPFLSLSLPSVLPFRRYEFGELSAQASATLREGLTRLARHLPRVIPHAVADVDEVGDAL